MTTALPLIVLKNQSWTPQTAEARRLAKQWEENQSHFFWVKGAILVGGVAFLFFAAKEALVQPQSLFPHLGATMLKGGVLIASGWAIVTQLINHLNDTRNQILLRLNCDLVKKQFQIVNLSPSEAVNSL